MILVTAGRGARATTKYVYLRCVSTMSVPRASESVRCARDPRRRTGFAPSQPGPHSLYAQSTMVFTDLATKP